MFDAIMLGIVLGGCTAAVSFLIMRKRTSLIASGSAWLGGVVVGFVLGLPSLLLIASISGDGPGHHPMIGTGDFRLFETAVMLATFLGPIFGPLEAWAFTRRNRAYGKVSKYMGRTVVTITGRLARSRQMVTLSMSEREWAALPAVQAVLTDQLNRRDLAPDPADASPPPLAGDAVAWNTFRDYGWVILTGRRDDDGGTASIEIPRDQWYRLAPLQQTIAERLTRRGATPELQLGPSAWITVPVWIVILLVVSYLAALTRHWR
jgi:hypothetical protein